MKRITAPNIKTWVRQVPMEETLNLMRQGICIYFEQEKIDSQSSCVISLLQVAHLYVEIERERNSERQKALYRQRVFQGTFQPSRGKYFGFNTNEHIFKPDENAPVVKLIFSLFISGKSYREIATAINAMEIKNSRGNNFSRHTIRNILKNEIYVGDIQFQKKPARDINTGKVDTLQARIYVFDHHTAIIDRETWNQAQEMFKE